MENTIPVIITTEPGGVFFGFVDPKRMNERTLGVHKLRNVIYWSEDTGGVFGLAATGPAAYCRVGAEVPGLTILHQVLSVSQCSPAAVAEFAAKGVYRE